ncbi:MAG: DNA-directed RNA polymerase subunit alpha [Nitrospirota bacterium]
MKIRKRGFQLPKKIHFDTESLTDTYGKFYAEPFERGFGTTIGNSLRRVLLSSLEGAAITSVRIDGIVHEFSTIKGVVEDVTDIILNLKNIRFKMYTDRPKRLHLKARGPCKIKSSDISLVSDVETLTPDAHIATLDKNATVEMELMVKRGRGYLSAEGNKDPDQPVGVIPIDSIFSPIRKVNFWVENARVGGSTDYDKLIMEIWTDGSISPQSAVSHAASILRDHLSIFTEDEDKTEETVVEPGREEEVFNENLLKSVEELELSVRAYNCLKNANIKTIADLVQKTEHEMLKTKNFGRKSLNEIKEILAGMGLYLGMKIDVKALQKAMAAIEK